MSVTHGNAVPLLRVAGLRKRYGGRNALAEVAFSVAAGDIIAVLGSRGAGETTLIRCVTRQIAPDYGEIVLAGRALHAARGAQLRQIRRFSAADQQLALGALDQVGLLAYAAQHADRLAGSQQQRVAIARVLAQQRRRILADAPIASRDPATAAVILGMLRSIAQERGIAVRGRLQQAELARTFADRIIGLRDGCLATNLPASQREATELTHLYHAEICGPLRVDGLTCWNVACLPTSIVS